MIPVIIAGTILLMILAGFIITFFFVHNKRRKVHQLELRQVKSDYEKELLRSQLEIQENILQNIAQEIHDNIGQVLSLAKLNLHAIARESESIDQKVNDTKNLVAKAISDLRNISKGMNTSAIVDIGFIKALQEELDILKATTLFQTKFQVSGNIYKLDDQKELIIFRTCQEILNNIIKHANASLITVSITAEPSGFLIIIEDNGDGFKVSETAEKGQGLRNIRNRMKLIGAILQIESVPSVGTKILIDLKV